MLTPYCSDHMEMGLEKALTHRGLTDHVGLSPHSSWTDLNPNVASLILLWVWRRKVRENSPAPVLLSLPSPCTPTPWFSHTIHHSSQWQTRRPLCHVIQSATGRWILGRSWLAFAFSSCKLHQSASGGKVPPQLWQTIKQNDRARCTYW